MSDADLLAQIAQLSGAINRAKLNASGVRIANGRGIPILRGRGLHNSRGRGRGRLNFNKSLVLNSSPASFSAIKESSTVKSVKGPSTSSLVNPSMIVTTASPSSLPKKLVINGVAFIMHPHGKKLVREGSEVPRKSTGMAKSAIVTPKRLEIGGISYVRTKHGNLLRAELAKKKSAPSGRLSAKTSSSRRTGGGNLVLDNTGRSVGMRPPGRGRVRGGRGVTTLGFRSRTTRKQKETYCKFYNRIGICNRGPKCHYIHDPSHRVLCRAFLKGNCTLTPETCLLSHTPTPHTMPNCVHFQRGVCTKENCPFSHVRVNPKAKVCRDFALEGYCPKGIACTERHVWICPDFDDKEECPRGEKCYLRHLKKGEIVRTKRKSNRDDEAVSGTKRLKQDFDSDYQRQHSEEEEGFLRFNEDDYKDWYKNSSGIDDEELMIRPDFGAIEDNGSEDSEDEEDIENEDEVEETEDGNNYIDGEKEEQDDDDSDVESVESDILEDDTGHEYARYQEDEATLLQG